MRDPSSEPHERIFAAKAALSFVHPRLAAVAHTADDGTLTERTVIVLPDNSRGDAREALARLIDRSAAARAGNGDVPD